MRLYAESETEFFLRVAPVQISFVRDASGAVTELIVHQGGEATPPEKVR